MGNALRKEDRWTQKRKWITKKRLNKESRDKENKAQQAKRSAKVEKLRELNRQAFIRKTLIT